MNGGYESAVRSAAFLEREDRAHLVVRGRAPRQMLNGIVSGTMPDAPVPAGDALSGVASYTAVLTPKGKMITDGRVLLLGAEETDGFLLDVPTAGRDGLVQHLRRFLPPRMASVEDVSSAWAVLSVVGPEAAVLASRLALGRLVAPGELSASSEGGWWTVREAARTADAQAGGGVHGLVVMRWADVWPEAFDVLGPPADIATLRDALGAEEVPALSAETWNVLRVEAGRPAFGVDMDDATIPVEAGIHERAIDYGKGCYTGQEVVVRIRDRGHVNRTLRLLRLGRVEPPAPGAELYADGAGKAVGVVTSAVRSPRDGETLALGYVRSGVEGKLTVGA